MTKILSKIIVSILSLWAIFIIFSELMGVTVYFPFNFVEREEIPYHRINSVRLSVFLTFIYFGVRYIFFQSEKLYPIQFLDVYLEWESGFGDMDRVLANDQGKMVRGFSVVTTPGIVGDGIRFRVSKNIVNRGFL